MVLLCLLQGRFAFLLLVGVCFGKLVMSTTFGASRSGLWEDARVVTLA